MRRRNFLTRMGTGTMAACSVIPLLSAKSDPATNFLKKGEIQHMVIFDLIHEKGKDAALKFLNDSRQILSKIPGVRNFEVLDQVSLKNDYTYGFSMYFSGQMAYDSYSKHPAHQAFVEYRWKKEVKRFLEIDFRVHEE
jgi:hypothetical protein